MLPEICGVDATVLDVGEGEFLGVNVVERKERGDAVAAGDGGDESGHPVVAVDQVWSDLGDGVIDDFPLEGEGEEMVLRGIDAGAVVEDAILGEVNALFRQGAADFFVFEFEDVFRVEVEHAPVVWQGHMDVGTLIVESLDEGGGDIGEAAGFGAHALGQVSHAVGEIGDFGSDDEDPGAVGIVILVQVSIRP